MARQREVISLLCLMICVLIGTQNPAWAIDLEGEGIKSEGDLSNQAGPFKEEFHFLYDEEGWNFSDEGDPPGGTCGCWEFYTGVNGVNNGCLIMILGDWIERSDLRCSYEREIEMDQGRDLEMDFWYKVEYGSGLIPAEDKYSIIFQVEKEGGQTRDFPIVLNANTSCDYVQLSEPINLGFFEAGENYYFRIVVQLSNSRPNETGTLVVRIDEVTIQARPYRYGGGTGDANDPFLISDPNHMQAIGAYPEHWETGTYFKLVEDIDLSRFTGTQYNIIGYYNSSSDKEPFLGVFDGNGHKIHNFTYSATSAKNGVGLFGYLV